MSKKDKKGVELLKELVAGLKLEGREAEAFGSMVASVEQEIADAVADAEKAAQSAKTAANELDSSQAKVKGLEADLATEKNATKDLRAQLEKANALTEAAEEKAELAEQMLKEAAEQMENTVTTKKGVAKTKVKVGSEEYMVNPIRKITGIPGYGDRVFTGADVIANAVKVKEGDKQVGLREYLAATGASILEPSNGRK